MDGYASKGAALILDGMKITTNADVPKAIIGDVDILKNAPFDMIQAGYGDIIGKYSCLNDWKLTLSNHPMNRPTATGFIPDSGAIAAFCTASTGKVPTYFGKPYKETVEMIA